MSECLEKYETGSVDYDTFADTPEDYQKYVKRLLSIHAYSEVSGGCDVAVHLAAVPNYKLREVVAKIIYEETRHAHMLYKILEQLGIEEAEAVDIATGKAEGYRRSASLEGIEAVSDDGNSWADLLMNHLLVERAGEFMVRNFSQSSFKPWAEASTVISKEEQWHISFGLRQFKVWVAEGGLPEIEKVFAKWYVHALNFFGPEGAKSEKVLADYGLKPKSNGELRREFIADVGAILDEMNLAYLVDGVVSDSYPYQVINRPQA
ncbi:MAG: Phenylacetic acid catabolic protein [Pseudomonadota bacterium]